MLRAGTFATNASGYIYRAIIGSTFFCMYLCREYIFTRFDTNRKSFRDTAWSAFDSIYEYNDYAVALILIHAVLATYTIYMRAPTTNYRYSDV